MVATLESIASQKNAKEKIAVVVGMEVGTPEKETVT